MSSVKIDLMNLGGKNCTLIGNLLLEDDFVEKDFDHASFIAWP